jgi:hypothetical protein
VLNIIRNNSPYTAVLLFIFALAIKMQALIHPVYPQALESQVVYGSVLNLLRLFLGKSAFAFTLFAVLMIYLQAIYLNAIAANHRLYVKTTYLVAYSYIIITSTSPSLSQFSSQIIINWLLLLTLNELLNLQQAHHPNKNLFNIGLLLMMAALIQFSAIIFLPFLFIALGILRPFHLREWVIALLGVIMPLYLTGVVLFLYDKLPLLRHWPDVGISLPKQIHPASYYLGCLSFILILFAGSLFNMQSQLPKSTIYIRRCWIMLSILLVFSILASVFCDNKVNAAWLTCMLPLSLMLAHVFNNEKSKRMNNISFYFSIAFVLFCQIFLPK